MSPAWWRLLPNSNQASTYEAFYGQDERRRRSEEASYGSNWRHTSDSNATWELRWLKATRELCAFRHPGPDIATAGDMYGDATLITLASSWTVELLAIVESTELLEEVLAGWESHVDDPDGLQWVRLRLAEAAALHGPVTRGDGPP